MIDDRIGVGFAGCGAISRLYTDIYAGLSDVARVVAVADPQPERAEHRRARQIEAYHAAAHAARLRAGESRDDETRARELRKAALAESAATAGIRVYRDHEGLLRDEAVQAMVLLTTPTVRAEPTIAAAEAGRHVFTQGPMAASVAERDGNGRRGPTGWREVPLPVRGAVPAPGSPSPAAQSRRACSARSRAPGSS